jgi:cyclic pyranopterin phosphate synthase
MAKDRFNREIDYLRISVTDRCNFGCIYCMPDKKPRYFQNRDLLTDNEIVRSVRIALKFGVRQVRLTGGEPLLRKGILRLISSLKSLGLRNLSLTTNGSLLKEMAGSLKDAGLDRVNISLDTMDPEKYRRITCGGELENVEAGIRKAEEAGLSTIKINMVPIRGINDDEIISFAKLTFHKPYHIRFIEFMPSGSKEQWEAARCITSSEIMERVSALGPLKQREFRGKGPSRNYRIDGAIGIIGFISPVSHNFCYCCNRLRINAVGKLRPCLFSKTEIDIGTPMKNGADDGEIERLFALAISVKPEGNYLQKSSDISIHSMSSIGG